MPLVASRIFARLSFHRLTPYRAAVAIERFAAAGFVALLLGLSPAKGEGGAAAHLAAAGYAGPHSNAESNDGLPLNNSGNFAGSD